LHPSGVAKSSTSFSWGKGCNVTDDDDNNHGNDNNNNDNDDDDNNNNKILGKLLNKFVFIIIII